jgi:adenosylcobyric acid synthase
VRGAVVASMVHRMFDTSGARSALLSWLRQRRGLTVMPAAPAEQAADPYEVLADHVQHHLDCDRLLALARA